MSAIPEQRLSPIALEAHQAFEAARRLEADGDYDAAFDAYDRANQLRRSELFPEGLARLADLKAEGNLRTYNSAFIRTHEGLGHPSAAPVFVVGMARSGSTLLEQILISHREVRGLGECNALVALVEDGRPFEVQSPDHFRRLGAAYLKALRDLGWNGSRRIVDKSLMNFLVVGLIHLIFPKASIIHAVRDPVDTCLSIWRRNFNGLNDTSYDLADIGRDYQRYRRMMDHWAEVLPGRVVEVCHEALVAEPEPQMRRLIAAAGLGWDPACLSFHSSARQAVGGASDQVRLPMSGEGVGRWRNYAPHLGPLLLALGPYAPQDGA